MWSQFEKKKKKTFPKQNHDHWRFIWFSRQILVIDFVVLLCRCCQQNTVYFCCDHINSDETTSDNRTETKTYNEMIFFFFDEGNIKIEAYTWKANKTNSNNNTITTTLFFLCWFHFIITKNMKALNQFFFVVVFLPVVLRISSIQSVLSVLILLLLHFHYRHAFRWNARHG